MQSKTIVVYNPGRFAGEAWLPVLWAQAKTYYERHGKNVDCWEWAHCIADIWGDDIEKVKVTLRDIKPDVLAISLYVWNYRIAHKVAAWVKRTFPKCIIITGGPHQYFKHDTSWFKKHPYLDASLPGECYGEICLTEVLDELSNSDTINWDNVTDITYPQGRSRLVTTSKKISIRSDKKNFDYSWSAFTEQFAYLKEYADFARKHLPKTKVLSIIETTRGCPYGCTYCDWGGGINTTVIRRPSDLVKQDIDMLCKLDLTFIYFADANFGIFGDRDVEIIQYLARKKKENKQNFSIGYGGFAKTENRLPTIKKILEIDINHQLSKLGEVKISMQSLMPDVLRRIDRKNINLDDYLATAKSATNLMNLPVYVELIYGLPGLTLEHFYQELNILGDKNLSIQWYPWILLPEAPAYGYEYRQREGIVTIVKDASWWAYEDDNSNNEIVIETSAYTKDDYFEMLMSSCLYKMIIQGGYFKDSVKCVKEVRRIPIGSLIRNVYTNFVKNTSFHQRAVSQWQNHILKENNTTQGCFIDIQYQGNPTNVFMGLYLAAIAFTEHEEFTCQLASWLKQEYRIPSVLLEKDLSFAVTDGNFNKVYRQWPMYKTFRKINMGYTNVVLNFLMLFTQFHHTGTIMRGRKSFLNLF